MCKIAEIGRCPKCSQETDMSTGWLTADYCIYRDVTCSRCGHRFRQVYPNEYGFTTQPTTDDVAETDTDETTTTVQVSFEEHLNKTVDITVPVEWVESRDLDRIIDVAIAEYDAGNIVLTADDFSGIKMVAITDDGLETEWEEF